MKTAEAIQIAEEGTFIPMQAAKGKETAVADLLSGAASIVRKTEPQTLQWFALRQGDGNFAIIDFFEDEKGREAHFAGQVAAALQDAADGAIEGGWEQGVMATAENSKVLSSTKSQKAAAKATLAVRIDMKAKPGKEAALADMLSGGSEIVRATEPKTLVWYALQNGKSTFAIFDVFAIEADKNAHFAGKLAAELKAKAGDLIEGGWDQGVVANIENYQILSFTY
jgi:quinol monooxygenase YgiN